MNLSFLFIGLVPLSSYTNSNLYHSSSLISLTNCTLLKLYFGVNIPDANAPYRLMKAETVKKYLYRMPIDYNLPNIMLTAYFAYYKEKIDFKEMKR